METKWKHRPLERCQIADLNVGQGRNRTTDTRIFSEGDSRELSINHLQRLPAPSPASPRHNYGTPNLSSSHSRHSGVCGLIPFSAPNNQRDQTIKLGNEDIFANGSLRAQLC